MLPRSMGGVVDNRLKVYGTANVRVVDASVQPLQLCGHPMANLYAIAESVSDMIKEDAGVILSQLVRGFQSIHSCWEEYQDRFNDSIVTSQVNEWHVILSSFVNIISFSIKTQPPNIIHKAWFCVFKGLLQVCIGGFESMLTLALLSNKDQPPLLWLCPKAFPLGREYSIICSFLFFFILPLPYSFPFSLSLEILHLPFGTWGVRSRLLYPLICQSTFDHLCIDDSWPFVELACYAVRFRYKPAVRGQRKLKDWVLGSMDGTESLLI